MIESLKGPLEWLWQRYNAPNTSRPRPKVERYKEYEIHFPEDHDSDHSAVWTAADGVWYCRDCHEWYRTWKHKPHRPKRQREGW